MSQLAGKGKKLSRRQFIKLAAGGAAAAAVVAPGLGLILGRAAAQGESVAQEAHDGKKVRRWAFIIDLRKCDGCVTIDAAPGCVEACIKAHYVPEGQQWIQVYEKELPGGGKFFMPTPCFHCENAPCVNVCPVGATFTTKEGLVLIDQRICIGCRFCMAACPYQRRFFNWGQPKQPPEASFAEYSPEYPVPAIRGTVMKCIGCAHLTSQGKLPACVTGCPMKAIYWGDLNEDIATNGVEIVQLSRFLAENNAFRYKEELGTQPRVWYLPGHGQVFGRHAQDAREPKEIVWPWGD